MRRPRGGFTLMEMLVVLSMIGILASTSVWHYGRQADRARDTAVRLELSALRAAVAEFRAVTGELPATLAQTAGRTMRRVPVRFRAARATGEYAYDPAKGDVRLAVREGERTDPQGRSYADY